jgi:hypothetical protein
MATYDTAELLADFKLAAQLPENDESIDLSQMYRLLRNAQAEIIGEIAGMGMAESQFGAPVKLTTADGGLTYTFGSDDDGNPIFPIGAVEIKESPTGRVWRPGAEWDADADFIMEGDRIRFPQQKKRTYANGPWARFVAPPGQLDVDSPPVLKPAYARTLIVWRALVTWATFGGLRDPAPYQARYDALWFGKPEQGNYGILGALQKQVAFPGAPADADSGGRWWDGISTGGDNYTRTG